MERVYRLQEIWFPCGEKFAELKNKHKKFHYRQTDEGQVTKHKRFIVVLVFELFLWFSNLPYTPAEWESAPHLGWL